MMNDLVIFGAAEQAEVVHFYFDKFTNFKIKAFVVDDEYIQADTLLGLPIVATTEARNRFPACEYMMFVALGYSNNNLNRRNKFQEFRKLGYKFPSYVSTKASILIDHTSIGENTLILEENTIQPFVEIGNNVVLWSGNHVGHHSKVRDHVFITSHVVISGGVTIEEECFLGVNSTIRDHLVIGKGSIIGANAYVHKNAPNKSLYRGLVSVREEQS